MKKSLLFCLMILSVFALNAERIGINSNQLSVNVISSDDYSTVIDYSFGSFERMPVAINGETYYQITLRGEPLLLNAGSPSLPKISRSIVIPDAARMSVEASDFDYVDYQMKIVPSKGNFTRNINPQDVPYTFSEVYSDNEFYPLTIADSNEPYILRDYRGLTVNFYPFSYNPVTETLRVYYNATIVVTNTGNDNVNIKDRRSAKINSEFKEMYNNHFINLNSERYEPVSEMGRLIVICHASFMDAITPYVEWKRQKGLQTDLYDVAEIGTNGNALKAFIQEQYDLNDGLVFVQLVGDIAQIPTVMVSGDASDPSYALLEGNDNYPDIFIGRFSAENVDHVNTQVERTVHYERDLNTDATWLEYGEGIGSSQGAGQGDDGEADWVHLNNIRADLLEEVEPYYNYQEVDQIYETNGGNASMVANGLNEGRGIINYCGHGSTTTWVTTGFSNSNVNQLVNDYKLPFINSVACVNGDFDGQTCFAEAWLRATNNTTGVPTGAIAMYASSINQSWAPPMAAQDEVIDVLVGTSVDDTEGKITTGGLFYNSSCLMLDEYNDIAMYKTWHIFGDCALVVRTATPETMTLSYQPSLFIGVDQLLVNTGVENALACLSFEGQILGSGYTDVTGSVTLNLVNVPAVPTDLTLTVTAFNKVTEVGTVALIPNNGAYVVYNALELNDNNGLAEYGEEFSIDLSLNNVGSQSASNLNVIISSNDPYVNILTDSTVVELINAESILNLEEAFTLQIAGNVPDQHTIAFTLRVYNETNEWTSPFSIMANAPLFNIVDPVYTETTGNGNGRFDAGEIIEISFTVQNTGHAISPAGVATFICNNPYVTVTENISNFDQIDANNEITAVYTVSLSPEIEIPSTVVFGFGVVAGQFVATATYSETLAFIAEGFETGDLLSYPWVQSGPQPWIAQQNEVYNGTYAAQTGDINGLQSVSIEITFNVPMNGQMSFAKKVSSEDGWDFFRFYIDGTEEGEWSGEEAWSVETYDITTGSHTFMWTYSKDSIVDSGSDCAWLDDIYFPSSTIATEPIFSTSTDEIDFGQIDVNETATQTFMIYNFGNETLSGTVGELSGFEITMEERNLTRNYGKIAVDRDVINYQIAPGSYAIFNITFMPTENIVYDGIVAITSNDPNVASYDLNILGSAIEVDAHDDVVTATKLIGNYPNPFNPVTSIKFNLVQNENVSLEIYNVLGQKVKTLVNEKLSAGKHSIVWEGNDNNGNKVASGIYFYKLTGERYTSTKKMLLLK